VNIESIATAITQGSRQHKPVLIAIEGFGGSGKTTIADKLKASLDDAYIINIDDFIVKSKVTESSWDKGAFCIFRSMWTAIPETCGQHSGNTWTTFRSMWTARW